MKVGQRVRVLNASMWSSDYQHAEGVVVDYDADYGMFAVKLDDIKVNRWFYAKEVEET